MGKIIDRVRARSKAEPKLLSGWDAILAFKAEVLAAAAQQRYQLPKELRPLDLGSFGHGQKGGMSVK